MVRVRCVTVVALSHTGMTLQFWLKEQIESPRSSAAEHLSGRDWIYHVRIATINELDDEVPDWVCRTHQVGCQLAWPRPRPGRWSRARTRCFSRPAC